MPELSVGGRAIPKTQRLNGVSLGLAPRPAGHAASAMREELGRPLLGLLVVAEKACGQRLATTWSRRDRRRSPSGPSARCGARSQVIAPQQKLLAASISARAKPSAANSSKERSPSAPGAIPRISMGRRSSPDGPVDGRSCGHSIQPAKALDRGRSSRSGRSARPRKFGVDLFRARRVPCYTRSGRS